MIAMALACDPRLIVADEPTTALDVMIQAQILRLIEQLVAEQDIGLLMISHDLAVLADTCDRLAVMYAGRVVEEGPARAVYDAAAHPYGTALSAAFPRIGDPASRRAPRGLPGDPPDPAALPSGCAFHPRCPVALDACATRRPAAAAPPGAGPRVAACVRVRSSDATAAAPVTTDSASRTPDRLLLSATALHVTFPGRRGRPPARAVDGVDLDIGAGEIVALVGESGCGKTTLARTLLGLVPPTAGGVTFAGEPLGYRSARPQGVPQAGPAGAPGPERLAQPAAHGVRRGGRGPAHPRVRGRRAARLSPRRCPGPGSGRPSGSSCAIRTSCPAASASASSSRARWCCEPELIVADEPVASLDASVRGEILALLLRCATNSACPRWWSRTTWGSPGTSPTGSR